MMRFESLWVTFPEACFAVVKEKLWGGEFWSKGYFISTVGRHGSEETVQRYVEEQNRAAEYKRLHQQQLKLFG